MVHWSFGLAWLAVALALALHTADEARHDFLPLYNANAQAIRRRFHVPVPVFTFSVWLGGLIGAVCLLLLLSPLAFHGTHWIRVAALVLGVLIGIGNGLWHIAASVVCRRKMPGVLSSPILLAAGTWLLLSCWT